MILSAIDGDGIVRFVEGRGLETAGVRPDQLIGRHPFAHARRGGPGSDHAGAGR